MANRPVFVAVHEDPKFVDIVNTEFEWFSGFAPSQKQKSMESLHESFGRDYPELKILEISTKSERSGGIYLSAFNLVSQTGSRSITVECAFQASKVFENGGPYLDLLYATSKDAKRDERLRSSGRLLHFQHKGFRWPLEPKTLFYDWLYMRAVWDALPLRKYIVNFDAFTDIEFNPEKSVNCQARSAALFVSLHRAGKLEEAMSSIEGYLKVMGV
jgi:type I restriction enzyme M protein